jgi:hypothetical protein
MGVSPKPRTAGRLKRPNGLANHRFRTSSAVVVPSPNSAARRDRHCIAATLAISAVMATNSSSEP